MNATAVHAPLYHIASFLNGSSCARNGKGAHNTPEHAPLRYICSSLTISATIRWRIKGMSCWPKTYSLLRLCPHHHSMPYRTPPLSNPTKSAPKQMGSKTQSEQLCCTVLYC
eukprot:3967095-Pyramimonas_sp.AAC.1